MKRFVVFLSIVVLSAFFTYAQESTGEIIGKVTLAEDGSPLPGVTVTLTGETYGKSTFITTSAGNFRFWKLGAGNYNLRFELQGFKPVERLGIRVGVRQTVTIDVAMEPGGIEEEVTVIGQAGMIDTRKAQVSSNYTKEIIQTLPIAMRTAEIINLAPGVMSAYPQIAGQGTSTLHGFGVQNYRAEYSLDGASFRDTYGHGNMPTSVATARLEEAQVTTTGQDITNVQGGPSINFVTRRGGNRLAGDSYIALLDHAFQADKYLPKYMKDQGYKVNTGIYRVYDYGAALGGPIFKDHLWFFASWAVVLGSNQDYYGKPTPYSYSPDMYGKVNAQWKTAAAEFSYAHTDTQSLNAPFSSTILNSYYNYDRLSPADTYVGQASVTLWQKLLLTGKFTYFISKNDYHQTGVVYTGTGPDKTYDQGRTLNPIGQFYTYNYFKSPPYNTEKTSHWQTYEWERWRPYVVVEGNYFAEKLLGGDHEIKVGFDRNYAWFNELYLAPNQMFNFIYPATMVGGTKDPTNAPIPGPGANYWGRIRTYCDRYGPKSSQRWGVYAQDIMNYGRFTLNLGFRVDWHAWGWKEAKYHALAPFDIPITDWDQWTGVFEVPGGKLNVGPTYSPRISLTFDVTGKGKDLIKLLYANYAGALDNLGFRTGFKKGYNRGEFMMPYIDYNGNYAPDWPTSKTPGVKNEFFLNDILGHWPTPDDILMMIAVGQAEQKALEAIYGKGMVPWNAYTYPGWFLLSFSGNPLGKKAGTKDPTDFLAKDFTPDRVLETSLSYEKQLSNDISVTLVGTYKREYNFFWTRGYYGTLSNHELVPPDTAKAVGTDPTTGWVVFGPDPTFKSPNGYMLTNYKHYYNYFKGLEFIFNKRLSHGWMLQASADISDWRVHYSPTYIPLDVTTPASAYTGPYNKDGEFARSTLYNYYHKAYAGVYEYGSTEPRQNARWHIKITGLVQLPWNLNLSGFIDAREGYIYDKWVSSYSGQVLPEKGKKFGDYRYPNFWYANLTLDRTFKFSDNVSTKVFVTGYNITNNVKTQMIHLTKVPSDVNKPIQINRPRIFQFGVRFSFR